MPIENLPDICPDCKRPHATEQPRDCRDPGLCYQRLQGRSRRAERSCAGHTIRRLQARVRELEAWRDEILIHRKVHNPPPGDALHSAVAIANAGLITREGHK